MKRTNLVTELDLSTRTFNVLKRLNITTVDELINLDIIEIIKLDMPSYIKSIILSEIEQQQSLLVVKFNNFQLT